MGAYAVTVLALLLTPTLTVPGGGLVVEVRPGATAEELELGFEASTADFVAPSVPRRSSAENRLQDRAAAAPVHVSIPRIGIDGPIVPVGIAPDRQLDVPFGQTAGWYRHSSLPSAAGASVIAAHVDFDGSPGLFFDLRLTVVGDTITVTEPGGASIDYVVTEVVLYDKVDLPSDELFRSSGEHALHLVTCGGSFDRLARSYRGNQVVTAVPVSNA